MLNDPATDTRYFARNKVSGSLVHKKKFWLDKTSSFQVRILILPKELGYLLSLNEFGEKSRATMMLGKLNKP